MAERVQVLIVGAGPAGLALACDLARRDVTVRVIDAADGPFRGSRAKGLQPRTLEVFDDLGVLREITECSIQYPPLGLHVGPVVVPWTMIKNRPATDDVPYPNTLLVAQTDTNACLERRLNDLGVEVEYGSALTALRQHESSVTADLSMDGRTEVVDCDYLIGADGGSSVVRRQVGGVFSGKTDDTDKWIIADVKIDMLRRDRWHVWRHQGRFVALCPLPAADTFQLMVRLGDQQDVSSDDDQIRGLIKSLPGMRTYDPARITWSSVFRPNIRLVDHYRYGRAFLVGDAAHVHTPMGGQGLNTGVQDSYNLGWKLGQALAGAPDALLDTYEIERRFVAARVLKLSTDLYDGMASNPSRSARRGDEERQLSITYRGGPLAPNEDEAIVNAGDRAPDATFTTADGRSTTIFDELRGPHFTLLAIGCEGPADLLSHWPMSGARLRCVPVPAGSRTVAEAYGVTSSRLVLVRPDGYIAASAPADDPSRLRTFLSNAMP